MPRAHHRDDPTHGPALPAVGRPQVVALLALPRAPLVGRERELAAAAPELAALTSACPGPTAIDLSA